jgi:hypothetical protein
MTPQMLMHIWIAVCFFTIVALLADDLRGAVIIMTLGTLATVVILATAALGLT